MFPSRRHCLIVALLLACAYGGPVQNERDLEARQAPTTTTRTTSVQATTSTRSVSSTLTTTRSAATAAVTTSSSRSTSRARTSSTSKASSSTPTASTSSTSTSTSTSTTASASATASSPSLFSKSSPYLGYAIGVLAVVCIFGGLLLVLVIRFLVQRFSQKASRQPPAGKAAGWRYSQDSELYSPSAMPTSVRSASTGLRHTGSGETGEREAFLSSESVQLYPAAKGGRETDRYTDGSTERRHSRSLSSASQSTATPCVSRRPGALPAMHSLPTHPAVVADQASPRGHSHSDEHELRTVPEESGDPARSSVPSLLDSDPYRQPTPASSNAMLSRAASTASAYSQPSGIHTPPPVPALPPNVLSDVSAALSTMQAANTSTETIYGDGLAAQDGHGYTDSASQQSTLRPTPGRMGLGSHAPASIHSNADSWFDHPR